MKRQADNAVSIDIVSDVVCPWCVIGYHQLAEASRVTGIPFEATWHPFEINPRLSYEGRNLIAHHKDKFDTDVDNILAMRERITSIGTPLGFTFNYTEDTQVWSSFRAHQLIDWAREHGRDHEATLALFAAFFTNNRNIADIDVLADIAAHTGLDRHQARLVLASEERAEQVRRDQKLWISRGVQGVPAMVFADHYLVSGAQGVENYGRLLERAREDVTRA